MRGDVIRPLLVALLVAILSTGCLTPFWESGASSQRADVPYRTESFVVPARRTHDLTLPGVQRGYRIDGYFVISGGGTDIGFRVRGPLGRDLIRELRVENRYDFNYTMSEAGPYTLVFDNSASFRADRRVMLFWRGYPAK